MTIYLVRHAHAGNRHDWRGDDTQRPLSKKGRAEAAAICDVLAEREVSRVLSSPSVRCQETVAPLARRRSVPLEVVDALNERASVSESMALLRSVLDAEAALCSHGDVIPDLIGALVGTGTRLHGRRNAAKGSFYVLEVVGTDVLSATYVEPASLSPKEPSKKKKRKVPR